MYRLSVSQWAPRISSTGTHRTPEIPRDRRCHVQMTTTDKVLLAACSELSRGSEGCTVHDLGDYLAIPAADAELALGRLKRRGFALCARMHFTAESRPHSVYYLTQRGLEQLHLGCGGF